MKQYNRVYANIDLDAIAYNMEQMKQQVGEGVQLAAVVKTDGYGHGAVPIAQLFDNTEYVWGFAVASLDEAMVLRKAEIKKPILVLGCVFPEQYQEAIEQEIRPAVYTEEMAVQLSETAKKMHKKVYIHIKIDTGMGRIGFPATEETADIITAISGFEYLETEGIFTHFAKADEADETFTARQHERFCSVISQLEQRGVRIPLKDCDNSAGIISYPDFRHNLVRAGISLYGMYPSDEVDKKRMDLKPALELVSHVIYVKTVEEGTPISYGGTFIAPRQMRVATIPVGYGDGYPRSLSNRGAVLIHGRRAPILGRICMDQFMVDVSDIPETTFMDRVVLIGRDGDEEICVEELADLSGRFHYEFVCCLSKRIPRNYLQEGRIISQADAF